MALSPRRDVSCHSSRQRSITTRRRVDEHGVQPVLPEALPARERWLTRQEAARRSGRLACPTKNRGGEGGRYVGKHVARFILIGLYTGTRAGAICAALTPAIGRGHVDLDGGKFYRKALVPRHEQAPADCRYSALLAGAYALLKRSASRTTRSSNGAESRCRTSGGLCRRTRCRLS